MKTQLQVLLATALLCASTTSAQTTKQFRVCADPYNLPFSNRQLEGFENKIAALVAKELGASPTYVWWGQRRGFIRNTMNASLKENRCDRKQVEIEKVLKDYGVPLLDRKVDTK